MHFVIDRSVQLGLQCFSMSPTFICFFFFQIKEIYTYSYILFVDIDVNEHERLSNFYT
jgi:hypothetical protein